MLIWLFQEKFSFVSICKVVDSRCNLYLINQLKSIWSYSRKRLLTSNIFFLFSFLLSPIFTTPYQCSNRAVSIDINLEFACINYVTLTNIVCSWSLLSLQLISKLYWSESLYNVNITPSVSNQLLS